MKRILPLIPVTALVLLLSACGFHLRGSAQLPAGMQRVYLSVSGSSDFRRALARALDVSGSTLVDQPGPGIATMEVPEASFSTHALTITGAGRISEYEVRFHVRFDVVDANGKILVPDQKLDMTREFTYDAAAAIGAQTQTEVLEKNLVDDMVNAVMFRLQAVGAHPAETGTVSAPARAASVR